MLRIRAVKELIADVAGLRGSDSGNTANSNAPIDEADDSISRGLALARKRAALIILLDWAAILVLVLVRSKNSVVLALGPTEESLFAIGLLAVATHAGFRVGQLASLRAAQRALAELEDRI